MREVKFRAFDKNRMVMYLNSFCTKYCVIEIGLAELHDLIWMQFTGVLDKNKKEIYEGDICKWSELNINFYFQIIFRDGIFGYELYEGNGKYKMMTLDGSEEVIGNIYENGDLLNEKI